MTGAQAGMCIAFGAVGIVMMLTMKGHPLAIAFVGLMWFIVCMIVEARHITRQNTIDLREPPVNTEERYRNAFHQNDNTAGRFDTSRDPRRSRSGSSDGGRSTDQDA